MTIELNPPIQWVYKIYNPPEEDEKANEYV